MRRQGKGMRLRPSPVALAALLVLVVFDRKGIGSAALLAALVHECGHILAARCLQLPMRELRVDVLGARLMTEGRMLSYGEEWLLAAAGPTMSLWASVAVACLLNRSYFALCFSASSLLLGLLNLLPVRSLDGGRMLEIACARFLGLRASRALLSVTSFAVLFLLWALSVYFLLRVGDGLSLLCFSLGLFTRFLEGEGTLPFLEEIGA